MSAERSRGSSHLVWQMIRDDRRALHVPMGGDYSADVAICGISGTPVEYDTSHAAMFCSICMRDAVEEAKPKVIA